MNIEMTKLAQIRPYPNNPRKNDRAVESVKRSIEQYGFQQPIVVDRDGVIIVGHTRYRAAQSLRLAEVPVIWARDLTDEQTQAYRLMDNRSNENAQWDQSKLVEELQALVNNLPMPEVSDRTGFTESELNRLFRDEEALIDQVRDRLTPTTYSQPGDIWTLGDHRVINGDSTDPAVIEALLQDESIDMVWEDAPYGVAYQTPSGINYSREYNELNNHKIANDTLTGEALDQFLDSHLRAVINRVRPGTSLYWCHDIRYNHQFKSVLEANGIHIADTLIWKKDKHSSWLGDYAKYYEPILYGWREGAQHRWFGKWCPNTIELDDLATKTQQQLIDIIRTFDTNYQEYKKEPRRVASLHPTVKPARLIAYHIINSSQPDEIVYDGFAGSGSTLMACEMQRRRARCVELEPKFVDVIIRRWQEHTGLQAVRHDGVLWDDLVRTPTDIVVEQNLTELFDLPESTNG